MRPFSEKMSEILFNRYFLQSFRLGEVSLYAPSSVEEFKSGYDSKLIGSSTFRELYLQFKAPTYSERKGLFTIQVKRDQHRKLKEYYPPRTAYYVAHMFSSLQEVTSVQKNLKIAADFLRDFIAIEISSLPEDVSFFQYEPVSHSKSPTIKYKLPSEGNIRTAKYDIARKDWLRGNQLVDEFKRNSIGAIVELSDENEDEIKMSSSIIDNQRIENYQSIPWQMSPHKAQIIAEKCAGDNFGVHIRK